MASRLWQPSQVQEKPEERVTSVATDTGPEPARASSAAADKEIQLPATDKRAVGTVEDSEMEAGQVTEKANVPGPLADRKYAC